MFINNIINININMIIHNHVYVQGGERIAWEFHHVTLQRVPGYGFGIAVSVIIVQIVIIIVYFLNIVLPTLGISPVYLIRCLGAETTHISQTATQASPSLTCSRPGPRRAS